MPGAAMLRYLWATVKGHRVIIVNVNAETISIG